PVGLAGVCSRLDRNLTAALGRKVSRKMDEKEARPLLKTRVSQLRAMSYHDLRALLDKETVIEVEASTGRRYTIETSVFWDGAKDRDLRVIVSIDDGGWRAYAPMTDDFIMAPDGSFVDE
ncbi:MAG TPA: hypothetical protein VFO75_04220, partial [Candidatus Dormibacteraeota bacterium]|nr:hypothetical protein [Candidatus Dormibacteraeota bacterium]